VAVGSCRVPVSRPPPDPVLLADTAMRLLPCKSARGEVMSDYLEGYVQALTNVLDDIEVEKCETVADVRRMIRQMIDGEGSE